MSGAEDTAAALIARAGGARIDPPLVAPSAPYIDLSGELVRARLLALEEPGWCLRPDLTIPVVLAHIAAHPQSDAGWVYYYDAPVFRFASRSDRRPMQIRMVGQERFNDPDPVAADMACLDLAVQAVRAGGVAAPRLTLGDAGAMGRFLDGLDLPAGVVTRLKRAAASQREFEDFAQPGRTGRGLADVLAAFDRPQAVEVLRQIYAVAGVSPVGGRSLEAIVDRLIDEAGDEQAARVSASALTLLGRFRAIAGPARSALDEAVAIAREGGVSLDDWRNEWETRLAGAAGAGMDMDAVRFVLGQARRFDYYDGYLFELDAPDIASPGSTGAASLGAGGRYDSLVSRLDPGRSATATGFSVRPAAIARAAARGNA